jgi:hypothetical protein
MKTHSPCKFFSAVFTVAMLLLTGCTAFWPAPAAAQQQAPMVWFYTTNSVIGGDPEATINIKLKSGQNPGVVGNAFFKLMKNGTNIVTTNGVAGIRLLPADYTCIVAGNPQSFDIHVTNSTVDLIAAQITSNLVRFDGVRAITSSGGIVTTMDANGVANIDGSNVAGNGNGNGNGNVKGPPSATDGTFPLFKGTGGDVITNRNASGTYGPASFEPAGAVSSANNGIQSQLQASNLQYQLEFQLSNTLYQTQFSVSNGVYQSEFQNSNAVYLTLLLGKQAHSANLDTWATRTIDNSTIIDTGGVLSAPSGGSGNVTGPNSAIVGHIATYNNSNGKQITDGGALGSAAFQPSGTFVAASSGASTGQSLNGATSTNLLKFGATGGTNGISGIISNSFTTDQPLGTMDFYTWNSPTPAYQLGLRIDSTGVQPANDIVALGGSHNIIGFGKIQFDGGYIGNPDAGADGIDLNNDGSARFAGGNFTVGTDGSAKIGTIWNLLKDQYDSGDGFMVASLTVSNVDFSSVFQVYNKSVFDSTVDIYNNLNLHGNTLADGARINAADLNRGTIPTARYGSEVMLTNNTMALGTTATNQYLMFAPASGGKTNIVSTVNGQYWTNLVTDPAANHTNIVMQTRGGGLTGVDLAALIASIAGNGSGAAVLARTNFYARDTNFIIYDPKLYQTINIGLLTNAPLIITNPAFLTNWSFGHVGWHQDTNGNRTVPSITVVGGTLRTNQNAKGAITPTANVADYIQLELADMTGTNVLISFYTNSSSYVDTNSLATGGGGGGGGGGGFSILNHGVIQQTSSQADNTSGTFDTRGATWIAIAVVNNQGTVDGFNDNVTENQGNTVVKKNEYGPGTGGRNYVTWFYILNPTTSATHQINIAGRIPNAVVVWGTGGTPAYDNNTGASGSNVGTLQPGSITGSASPCALFLASANYSSMSTTAVNSSFTMLENINSPLNGPTLAVYWLAQTTATAVNPTATFSASNGDPSVTMLSIH